MIKQTLGEFLGTLRKAHGYTQQEVAEKLNVSNKTLSSWETDRTTPDLLILPAIADLYGITIDELIRGMREENGERTELSENALHSARKYRYGKFSTKYTILTSVGCLCSVWFLVVFLLNFFVYTPLWLDLLLIFLSAGGVIACGITLLTIKHNLLVTEGIVISEDYTDDNKEFIFTVNRKFIDYLIICSIPLLVSAIVIILTMNFTLYFMLRTLDSHLDVVDIAPILHSLSRATISAILSITIPGLGLVCAGSTLNRINVTKFGSQTNINIFKSNRNLLLKLLGYGAIPFLVGLIMVVINCCLVLEGGLAWYFNYPAPVLIIGTFIICIILYRVKRKTTVYNFK